MTTLSGEYRTIKLSRGLKAKVDAQDFDYLSKWKWCATVKRNVIYAVRNTPKKIGKRTPPGIVYMHRAILRLESGNGIIVDHVNGDGLDNRRANLRLSSKRDNAINSKLRSDNTSGHRGVSFRRDIGKWRAYSFDGGRQVTIGNFCTKLEAELAYRAYCSVARFGISHR